jgi:hypothetical protein
MFSLYKFTAAYAVNAQKFALTLQMTLCKLA